MRGENDPPVSANHFSFPTSHHESISLLVPTSLWQLCSPKGADLRIHDNAGKYQVSKYYRPQAGSADLTARGVDLFAWTTALPGA
jgi:hypothetical protein